jgi:hypothetical protein
MQDGGQAGEEEQKQQGAGEFHGKWEQGITRGAESGKQGMEK